MSGRSTLVLPYNINLRNILYATFISTLYYTLRKSIKLESQLFSLDAIDLTPYLSNTLRTKQTTYAKQFICKCPAT